MNQISLLSGCGIELGKFGALVLGYSVVFSPLRTGVALVSALLGAVFALFLLNAVIARARGSRVQQALSRATERSQPTDGKLAAISGPLEALGDALASPFRQRPCVAYSYWVGKYQRVEDGGRILAKDARGFAFTSCAVVTAAGPVGIRGISFDTLEPFEEEVRTIPEARDEVRRYLDETHFEPDPGHQTAALGRGVRRLWAEWRDPPRTLRCDWGNNETTLGPEHRAGERVVAVGETVTAIGIYTSDPPELRSSGVDVLRLLPGDLEQARAALRTDATSSLFMAVLLFLISHAILIVVYHAAPRG